MSLSLSLGLSLRQGGPLVQIFDPTTVANMRLRHRASQAVTSSGNTLIDSIPNEGTLGTVAANQLNWNTNRPKFVAASSNFNGRPSCLFDGNQALKTTGNFSSPFVAQPSTWYAYTRITDTGDSNFVILRLTQDGSPNTAAPLYIRPSTDALVYGEGGAPSVTTSALYGKRRTCVVYDGANTALYIDDMTTPVATGTGGTQTATSLRIGFGFGVTMADFEWVEQLAYNGAHDAATRINIATNYLQAVYG